MKTLKTIVLLIVITITAPDAISQRAGIYKDLQFDSLYPIWSYTSYDPSIVGYKIDNPRDIGVEFDGYGHVFQNYNIEREPLIEGNDLYIISRTLYDGDLSGALIEKLDIVSGRLIWQSQFDLRTEDAREFIERTYMDADTLIIITYQIVTPDPIIALPVIAASGTSARGVLKIRKYNKYNGEIYSITEPNVDHPDVKLISPGPYDDIQCYPLENNKYELIQFFLRDTFGTRLYIDTLNQSGVKINPTDTIWSEIKDVNWGASYWSFNIKFFRTNSGEIYWLDFIVPDDENPTEPRATINITKNGKLINKISLDHMKPEEVRHWYMRKIDEKLILIANNSFFGQCTYYFIDYEGIIKNQYTFDGGCFTAYPTLPQSTDFVLPYYFRDDDNLKTLGFFDFRDNSVELISEFHFTDNDYLSAPRKLFQLDNGDYLYFASNREVFEGFVRGKFMTTYRLPRNFLSSGNELLDDNQIFKIYPNPLFNTDLLNLYFDEERSGSVLIYSSSGQLVHSSKIVNKRNLVIKLDDFASGIYHVVFNYSEGQYS